MTGIKVRSRPCASCPYRRDVPSGIWEAFEYDKLPAYDGDTAEQILARATGLFHCHSQPENLCAGWVGCHDMTQSFAVCFNSARVDPAIYDYVSPVPLFASGAEAAAHGKRDLPRPGPEARRKMRQLLQLQEARADQEADR